MDFFWALFFSVAYLQPDGHYKIESQDYYFNTLVECQSEYDRVGREVKGDYTKIIWYTGCVMTDVEPPKGRLLKSKPGGTMDGVIPVDPQPDPRKPKRKYDPFRTVSLTRDRREPELRKYAT
jgi:hypothetical protein